MPIEVGREAPDFTLLDTAKQPVTLSSFRGRRNVVLAFFPAAFSEFCTRQLTEVAGDEARYAGLRAQVIGVSVDNPESLRAFAESLGLGETILLGDFEPKGEVARRYGVYLPDHGIAGRATFVIDRDGVVRGVSLTDHPGQVPGPDAYFTALAACEA